MNTTSLLSLIIMTLLFAVWVIGMIAIAVAGTRPSAS